MSDNIRYFLTIPMFIIGFICMLKMTIESSGLLKIVGIIGIMLIIFIVFRDWVLL